jgi:hypothetical protein
LLREVRDFFLFLVLCDDNNKEVGNINNSLAAVETADKYWSLLAVLPGPREASPLVDPKFTAIWRKIFFFF